MGWIILQQRSKKAVETAEKIGVCFDAFSGAVNELGAEENLPEDIF